MNATGIAKTDIKPIGEILVKGKIWKAKTYNHQQISKDNSIKVIDIKNLFLIVKKN